MSDGAVRFCCGRNNTSVIKFVELHILTTLMRTQAWSGKSKLIPLVVDIFCNVTLILTLLKRILAVLLDKEVRLQKFPGVSSRFGAVQLRVQILRLPHKIAFQNRHEGCLQCGATGQILPATQIAFQNRRIFSKQMKCHLQCATDPRMIRHNPSINLSFRTCPFV